MLSATAVGAVILGLVWFVFHEGASAPLADSLPPTPDLSSHPPELARRVHAAQAVVARNDGDAATAVAQLGRLYQANGFNAAAATCWQLLATAQPREARWPYYLAELHEAAGDQETVVALVEHTVNLAPDYAPAWLKLAELRFKQGQSDAAATAYRQRLALLPADPYARVGLARITLQHGDLATARRMLESLINDVPGFAPGRNLYAEALAAAGDDASATRERFRGAQSPRFRDAADPWLDALIADCFDYDTLCVRGMMDTLTAHGDLGQALFERARQLQPHRLSAYELLGNVQLNQGNGAEAVKHYEEGLRQVADAVAVVPANYFVSLSRAYLAAHQTESAVRAARRGLARLGDNAELHRALGNALRAHQEPAAAVAALRTAVAINPADAATIYDLAVALLDLGQLEPALEALQRSHALNPQFPGTLSLLATIELDSGRWDHALRYLRPLHDGQPDLPEAREKLSFVYLQAGLDAEQHDHRSAAESHYRAAAQLTPRQPEPSARLGVLLLRQRRWAEAVAPLETFHHLAPADSHSALFLGQAYLATGRPADARHTLETGARLATQAGQALIAQQCQDLLQRLRR